MTSSVQIHHIIPTGVYNEFEDRIEKWTNGQFNQEAIYNKLPAATTAEGATANDGFMHKGSHPGLNAAVRNALGAIDTAVDAAGNPLSDAQKGQMFQGVHSYFRSALDYSDEGKALTGGESTYLDPRDSEAIKDLGSDVTSADVSANNVNNHSPEKIIGTEAYQKGVAGDASNGAYKAINADNTIKVGAEAVRNHLGVEIANDATGEFTTKNPYAGSPKSITAADADLDKSIRDLDKTPGANSDGSPKIDVSNAVTTVKDAISEVNIRVSPDGTAVIDADNIARNINAFSDKLNEAIGRAANATTLDGFKAATNNIVETLKTLNEDLGRTLNSTPWSKALVFGGTIADVAELGIAAVQAQQHYANGDTDAAVDVLGKAAFAVTVSAVASYAAYTAVTAIAGVVGATAAAAAFPAIVAAVVVGIAVGFAWDYFNGWEELIQYFSDPINDPLVLDLDGDGVELTRLENSEAQFDLDDDGFAETTGWVAPDDGLLVLDRNGNGEVDGIGELFGSPTATAFEELAELDSNGDGLIDSQDAQFADLQVWQDLNQDGVSDASELQSLTDAGIASISLASQTAGHFVSTNEVVATSTVTHTDGSTSEAAEVLFRLDQAETVFELPEDFVFDAEVFLLPWLPGFGEMALTPAAFTQDPELKAEAKGLIEVARSQGMDTFQSAFEDFLVSWAGVEDTKWLSEAGFVQITYLYDEDKKLAPGFDPLSGAPNPDFYIFDVIGDQQFDFDDVNSIAEQNDVVRPSSAYMPAFTLINTLLLDGTPQEGGISFLPVPPRIINDGGDGNVDILDSGPSVVGGRITGGPSNPIVLDSNRDVQDLDDQYVPDLSAEKFAVIQKLMGQDYTRAENSVAHDKIIVGVPDPDLIPIFSEQFDAIRSYFETRFLAQSVQSIILTEGEDADLGYLAPFEHIGYDVLNDVFFGDGAKFAVEFVAQYVDQGAEAIQNALENLKPYQAEFGYLPAALADSSLPVTEVQLEAVFGVVLEVGSNTSDTLSVDGDAIVVGGAGDDTLQSTGGSKVFMGGTGDDVLEGSSFADTYVYRLGDGNDTINDSSAYGSENDKLILTDVSAADVTFSQSPGQDLVITLSNGETITVTDHFKDGFWDLELIEFADGTIFDAQAIRDKTVSDQKASGVVLGSAFVENYVHSLGDGSYSISDSSAYGTENDKLIFTDVSAADVTFSQSPGQDLVITLSNGETITVTGHFRDGFWDLELIEFADGTIFDTQAIRDKTVADQKASGVVMGSAFAENYAHSLGDGSYSISDSSAFGTENDKLIFTDVNAADVTFSQNAGQDLVITLSNGETITVTGHFRDGFWDLELIEFADGTIFDTQAIRDKTVADQKASGVVMGSAFAENYAHSLGDGSYSISDSSAFGTENDKLIFTDVNAADVTFSQNAGQDLVITLSNGETITVTDHYTGSFWGLESIEFADGAVLDGQAIRDKSVSDQKASGVVMGSAFAENYAHSLGDGSYSISDSSAFGTENDKLIFTDVNAADVTFSQNVGQDLVITLNNGETITVTDHFTGNFWGLESIEFADGAVLNAQGILNKADADRLASNIDPIATDDIAVLSQNSTILLDVLSNDDDGDGDNLVISSIDGVSNGTAIIENGHIRYTPDIGFNGQETLVYTVSDGYGGSDTATVTITVNAISAPIGDQVGTSGADVFYHTAGDGSYTITDYDSNQGNDRLVFTDLNPSDVTLSRSGNNAVLSFANGETITLVRYLDENLRYSIETIEFADGTTWDHAAFRNQMVSDMKATGTVVGTERDETYVHSSGDGSYTISDYDTYQSNDRLEFTDLNPSDVTLSRSGNNAVLSFTNGETITLVRYLDENLRYSIETIEFADGTTWDHAAFRNQMVSDMKATGTVVGTERNEIYTHSSGDGSYTISDYDTYQSNDRLEFTDLNPSDVTLSRSGNNAVLSFTNGETITLVRYLDENLRYSIETIEFADGTTWDHAAFRNQMVSDMKATGTVVGTERNEIYTHSSGDGSYTISDYDTYQSNDRLEFTDLNPSDVTLSRSGNNAVLSFANGETITLVRYLDENLRHSFETIEFADGTTWDHAAFRNQMVSDMKATGTVVGTEHNETYTHNSGDGSYTISDYDTYQSNDRLEFTDLNPSDVTLSRSGNNAVLSFTNGETITLVRYLDENLRYSIETIEFADGTTWDHTAFRNQMVSDMKATGTVVGTERDETYVHSSGDGSYTISDYDTYQSNDEFVFTDINSTDVTVERLQSDPNDVVLTLSDGDQIILLDQLVSNNRYGVETIEFADGVEWTRSDLLTAPIVDDSLVFV
ncbi:calcium-binding protein [Ruegeria meonggei]|uniref:calcium-binding protein n=1 Tax=Ruegeria meonggei TaxID=1446476 RepID=UPI0036711A25